MNEFKDKVVIVASAAVTGVVIAGAALIVLSVIAGAIWSLMGWM